PPTSHLSTLSLHDALPILPISRAFYREGVKVIVALYQEINLRSGACPGSADVDPLRRQDDRIKQRQWRIRGCSRVQYRLRLCGRSEEHTSELQSPYDLVCR